MSIKKNLHKPEPQPKPAPEPEYKFVVLSPAGYGYKPSTMLAEPFRNSEDAIRIAELRRGSRIFGLNPEYDFKVIRALTMKEATDE
jgi:hypothetical protein